MIKSSSLGYVIQLHTLRCRTGTSRMVKSMHISQPIHYVCKLLLEQSAHDKLLANVHSLYDGSTTWLKYAMIDVYW